MNCSKNKSKALPIGVFDSGVGGLTVLRALMERLPGESTLYLGDTARLPYGTKSRQTITRYVVQAADKLLEKGIKLLVIACNTATAAAMDELVAVWPDLPVIGVVEPGAKAACMASKSGNIAVIATESTIRHQAYQKAIQRIRPDARVTGQACSLFVSLAEEGWTEGQMVELAARRYLDHIFGSGATDVPDCIVLGCTHFPPFAGAIAKVVGNGVSIVDSAATTALVVEETLDRLDLRALGAEVTARFMTTDDVRRFARIGSIFLGRPLSEDMVELAEL